MPDSVTLQINSRIDGEEIRQSFSAERYRKGDSFYFRYRETDPAMGRTATILKVAPGEIRILRHGDVESEQTFVPDGRRNGFYQTPQGLLELGTETRELAVRLVNGTGTVSWSYDLFVSGEPSGTCRLEIIVTDGA
ncbi:DUF1934 domain-containing protein [Paenibacillus sp. CC-CFT747]|nr:DUF1934 domain-containing protein [Paenibacillus sp. CC-CFT747]